MAIALAKLTPINPAFGFGLFISGCCPGGGASNVWTRLLGGDLDLSLTMTLFSSLAALGELLWLLVCLFYVGVSSCDNCSKTGTHSVDHSVATPEHI